MTELQHPGVVAGRTPDKPALIMAGSGEVVTYGELDERSKRGAQLFRAHGLGPGDTIAIYMENNARYMEVCWAAHRAGLYYSCISSQLTAPEAAYIVADSDAKLLVSSAAKGDVAAALIAQASSVGPRYMVGGAIPGHASWEEAILDHPAVALDDETEGVDMLYSSGTTGRPKGVRSPLRGEVFGAAQKHLFIVRSMTGHDENSIFLETGPLYHAAPLRFMIGMQRVGATSVIMERFDAEAALGLIEQYRCTHSLWVPSMFVRMLKLPEETRRRYDISSTVAAIHGAAPCPVGIKERMIDWFGPTLVEYYGATEANGLCLVSSEEWLARKGSVGKAVLGEVHIMDEEGREELPPGETGPIYFANGYEFEYYRDPEKTAEARNDRGWSTLGDIGRVDDDGYLYLTDRKAFTIITGGVNVYPQEVENLLVTHSKVMDAAVIGVPSEDFGEAVKAVIQPVDMAEAGAALEGELIAFCRQSLSPVKCPRSVDFKAELPRHPNGKLYKRLLKDAYWGDHGTHIV
jgi:acyl-CoA synthetase (AMP-forming)/AMP-acid ligase II